MQEIPDGFEEYELYMYKENLENLKKFCPYIKRFENQKHKIDITDKNILISTFSASTVKSNYNHSISLEKYGFGYKVLYTVFELENPERFQKRELYYQYDNGDLFFDPINCINFNRDILYRKADTLKVHNTDFILESPYEFSEEKYFMESLKYKVLPIEYYKEAGKLMRYLDEMNFMYSFSFSPAFKITLCESLYFSEILELIEKIIVKLEDYEVISKWIQ